MFPVHFSLPKPVKTGLFKASAIVTAITILSGCAIQPQALTDQEQVVQTLSDRSAMYMNQEPITGPITLDEAIARAVKYNLQQRVALMESAMEDNLRNVQSLSMLPKLTAQAGFKTRSNTYASSSYSMNTGRESLEPSTSQERQTENADLQLSWNVLDFGISYFGAKAQANKWLAAEERRRRVVGDIIREVRTAYWNAVTAQRLKSQVSSLLVSANDALQKAKQSGNQRLLAPITSLRYQRDLLGMIRQIEALDSDLAVAKTKLASLMNLPPSTQYDLVVPASNALNVPKLTYSLDDLETMSMMRRPEIREQAYEARNAVLETRMALLKLLPNAALFGGLNYDSNKYAVNHNWADAGMQVSWNLFSVLSWSSVKEVGKAREEVAELRRQALRMAVLTQVNVAYLEYQRATHIFDRSNELDHVQQGILQQTEDAYRSDSQTVLETIRTRMESILATRARDLSYADVQNSMSAIYQAAGIDPLPAKVADLSVSGLANEIANASVVIEHGQLAVPNLAMRPDPAPIPAVAAIMPAQQASAPVVNAAPVNTTKVSEVKVVKTPMWSSVGSLMSE